MSSVGPAVLRNDVRIDDPVAVVVGFLETWSFDFADPSGPMTFLEQDLRLANRDGARISAAQIGGILERRRAIERALRAIAPDASLSACEVPWSQLGKLFEAFAGIPGVGFSKMTKALHRKRPALIPMLDSVVQKYLADDDLGAKAPFGARALALVRGYKRDLDRNSAVMRATRKELARRGYRLTDVRVLDLLIWSVRD